MLHQYCHPRNTTAIRMATLLFVLAPALGSAAQTTYHVAPCGDDGWTGLNSTCSGPNGPKATIQAAIEVAVDGDTVVLSPGTYVGAGNADLDFGGRLMTLRSDSGDPSECIIEPAFGSRGFVFQSGETAAAAVKGVTVRNASAFSGGGALRIVGSSPTILHCVFDNNSSSSITGGQGGGAWIQEGSPRIISCVFRSNQCGNSKVGPSGRGGGMYVTGGGAEVINCMFIGNSATAAVSQQAEGGGLYVASGATSVSNSVFVSNMADDAGGAVLAAGDLIMTNCIVRNNFPDQLSLAAGSSVTYSNVEGSWPGQQNIDVDPLFADAGNEDLRLLPGSPCIDAGHNWGVVDDAVDIDGDGNTDELLPLDLDGGPRFSADEIELDPGCGLPAVVDMGPYEYQFDPADQVIFADIDGDGTVNVTDLIQLIVSWGECDGCCLSDLDLDGVVDVADLVTLVLNW